MIQHLQVAYEHRNLTAKREEVLRRQRMEEDAMAMQKQQMDLARRRQEAAEKASAASLAGVTT